MLQESAMNRSLDYEGWHVSLRSSWMAMAAFCIAIFACPLVGRSVIRPNAHVDWTPQRRMYTMFTIDYGGPLIAAVIAVAAIVVVRRQRGSRMSRIFALLSLGLSVAWVTILPLIGYLLSKFIPLPAPI